MGAFYTFLVPLMSQAAEAVDEATLARLMRGQVVVEETRLDVTGGSVRVAVLVHAPAETVWRVISSCRHAHRYLHGMQECEVLVDEPSRALTHHVVDPGWMAPKMDYRFETRRQPYRRMDIELTGGNLRQMSGYWRLEPLESGLLLEHEVHVRPEAPVPRWLVRRKLKRDLPEMMACIRGLAGGSPSGAVERADLAACQVVPAGEDQ